MTDRGWGLYLGALTILRGVRDWEAEAARLCWCGHRCDRHISNGDKYYCTDSAGSEGAGVCPCMRFAVWERGGL